MSTVTMTVTADAGGTKTVRSIQEQRGLLMRVSAKPVGSVNGAATIAVRLVNPMNTPTVLAATAANVAFDKYSADFIDRAVWIDGGWFEIVLAAATAGNTWTVELVVADL